MSGCCGCEKIEARALATKKRRVLITVLAINIATFAMMVAGSLLHGDVNMASAWECSRNDIYDGSAVILAAGAVWLFGAGWPDLLVAIALLLLFVRSAVRVLKAAWRELRGGQFASA